MATSVTPKKRAPKKTTQAKRASTAFDKLFASLNDEQKLAVETTEGPVMVIAGPGTGKTQVVALRTATILRKTHMRPRNILCLTFSKSGATAMRQRLRDIIGSDAYGVVVDTIHGFCNSIIRQNPQVFEQWQSLDQISDVERYRELNKIIDQLMPSVSLVSKKSPYTRTKDILQRISQLKREGVTDRVQLEKVAGEYKALLSTKSKEGTKAHKRNLQTAQKFKDFIEVFFLYQEMLERTGRYDYEDMILRVIQALEEEDWLLATLQERYQYILVDEFQDTNGAQYSFIEKLTTDPTGDNKPNFFVVGDDDQAIYRFQGANLTNILSFRDRFPTAPIIPLTTSYRCTQPILDAAEKLIEHNTERLVGHVKGLDKHLVSAVSKTGDAPRLLLSPSDMSEPWLLADLVEDRIEKGIEPHDIAILVQTNAELIPIYDVLEAREIPVELTGKLDLLSHGLVRQTLCVLRAIHDPRSTRDLAAALSCECFGCHPAALATLFEKARANKEQLLQTVLSMDEKNSDESIMQARDIILNLHNKLPSRTVVETLEHVLKETGILGEFTDQKLDVIDYAAVQEFFDRVKQRAYEQPSFSFDVFLSDLEFYDNDDYGDIRLTYDLPHLTENGVQLMTAHKSKGLEFHTVILANFREGHWDGRWTPPSLSIPEDLLFGWEKDVKSYEKQQDERRVAYVAITRAKRELLFTSPEERTSGDALKSVSPSAFFAEAGDLKEERQEVKDPERMSTLLASPIREFDDELKTFLKRRLENFALSPTALNDFLDDPQVFLEKHLLLVPQAKSSDFAYGNAVHHVLARWAQAVQAGKKFDEKALLTSFTEHLEDRELLSKKEMERLDHLGKQVLKKYFSDVLQPPYPIVSKVEYALSTHLDDIPIKGKIDRIDLHEPNSSAATVIDFKTGKPKTPKQIEDYGYHRQLVFYALLIEHSNLLLDPREFILEFVGHEEDEPVSRKFEVSDADKKELSKLIHDVWEKIVTLDFTPF